MLTKKHQAACLRAILIALFVAFGLVPCLSQPVAGSGSKLNEYTRLERRNWKHAPLTKNSLKAAQAMDRILREFKAVKTKQQEQVILRRYMRDSYRTALQTTEALYAAFYYGSKYRVGLSFGEERIPGLIAMHFEVAFYSHAKLADPKVVEYAKAAVLFQSTERFFNVPKETVRAVHKLFPNDPHSAWLLSVYEVTFDLQDKQGRTELYKQIKALSDYFPKNLVYLHSSDSRNSRIKLQVILMLISFRLFKHQNDKLGVKTAISHYNILMEFKNPDEDTMKTQARAKYLRTRFGF